MRFPEDEVHQGSQLSTRVAVTKLRPARAAQGRTIVAMSLIPNQTYTLSRKILRQTLDSLTCRTLCYR